MPVGPDVRRPPDRLLYLVERAVPQLWNGVIADARGVLAQWPETVLTSWWRSVERNAQVGGAQASQHLIGTALDLVPPRAQRGEVAAWLKAARWELIDEGDHLHVQVFRATSNVQRFIAWAVSQL